MKEASNTFGTASSDTSEDDMVLNFNVVASAEEYYAYDDDEGFWGYTSNAVDPGPIVLIATLIISFILLMMIPISLHLADKYEHRFRFIGFGEKRNDYVKDIGLFRDDDDEDDDDQKEKNSNERRETSKGGNDSISITSSRKATPMTINIPRMSNSTSTRSSSSQKDPPSSSLPSTVSCHTSDERDNCDVSEYGGSRMDGASVGHRFDPSAIYSHHSGNAGSNGSHISNTTDIVTTISGVMTSVIPNSPTRVPHSIRSNGGRRRRRQNYVDRLIREEGESHEQPLMIDASIDISARSLTISEIDNDTISDVSTQKRVHARSRPTHALGDDITTARDDVTRNGDLTKKRHIPFDSETQQDKKYVMIDGEQIDPMYDYDPRLLGTKCDKMLKIIGFDLEMKRLTKLMWPFATQALSTGLLDTIRMAIIGRVIGTNELAASVVVEMCIELSGNFCGGVIDALTTLCSQAIGCDNETLAGQYVQLSVVLYSLSFAPFMFLWAFFMQDICDWLGFDAEVGSIATSYAYVLVFDALLEGFSDSIHGLLDITEREKYSTVIGLIEEVIAFITILCCATFASDSISLVNLSLIEFGIGVCFLLFNMCWIAYKGWFKPYLVGMFGSFALFNKKALSLMLRTASALSFGFLLTEGEWELLTVFASFIGAAEVSAWGVLGTIWGAIEELTESVGDAGEVRVAFLLGSGQPCRAKLSGYKTMTVALIIAFIISGLLWTIGEDLPVWITNDPTLQHIIADLIPIFGFGNLALTMGGVSWTLLGAQGRYRLSTCVAFLTSFLVTLPLAATLSIGFNINLQGQTAAVVIGYMVTGTVNSFIFFRSDWERLSREIAEHNRILESSSSSSSSDDDSSSSSSSSLNGSSIKNSRSGDSSFRSLDASISTSRSRKARSLHSTSSKSSKHSSSSSSNSSSKKNSRSGGSPLPSLGRSTSSNSQSSSSSMSSKHSKEKTSMQISSSSSGDSRRMDDEQSANELEIIYENEEDLNLDNSFHILYNRNDMVPPAIQKQEEEQQK